MEFLWSEITVNFLSCIYDLKIHHGNMFFFYSYVAGTFMCNNENFPFVRWHRYRVKISDWEKLGFTNIRDEKDFGDDIFSSRCKQIFKLQSISFSLSIRQHCVVFRASFNHFFCPPTFRPIFFWNLRIRSLKWSPSSSW